MPVLLRSATRGFAALSFVLLAGTMPALANPQTETVITATSHGPGTVTRSARIAYGDLNLADARDQHRLSGRIREAADAVCAIGQDELWNQDQGADYRRCREQAIASAAVGVRTVALAALD